MAGSYSRPFSATQLRKIAEEYLEQHHPSGEIPIPIDEIIEGQLGIDIIACPNLRDHDGIDGFVSRDWNSIIVDRDVMMSRSPRRYRFTLAHELSHIVLHQRVFQAARYTNQFGWIDFLKSLPHYELQWIEWQANTMAGYLLVPQKQFLAAYEHLIDEIETKLQKDVRLLTPPELEFIAKRLADQFNVSSGVIIRQGFREDIWKSEDFPPSE